MYTSLVHDFQIRYNDGVRIYLHLGSQSGSLQPVPIALMNSVSFYCCFPWTLCSCSLQIVLEVAVGFIGFCSSVGAVLSGIRGLTKGRTHKMK